ncbi:MAG: hypothetical protein OXU36_11575 [Candidatus Poribacteria bacterium]|nr:hypothetical protein [Candidatus Poribacteria bacterium]
MTRKRNLSLLGIVMLSATVTFAHATENSSTVGELITGQWAEGRAYDPFSPRPVQLWLPGGTLIYNIEKSDRGRDSSWKFRFATTYHGYPVNLKLEPEKDELDYRERRIDELRNSFRLTESLYCPNETPAIVWPQRECKFGKIYGEGWTFGYKEIIETHAVESGLEGPTRLEITAILDEKTRNLIPGRERIHSFVLYRREMDRFEKKGVLVRLDRPHPLSTFEFISHYYFPCNSETSFEITENDIRDLSGKITVSAGFNFFQWLSGIFEGEFAISKRKSQLKIRRTKLSSSETSIFQQWGVMKDYSVLPVEETPFFVEKKFECQTDSPSTEPGKRILEVMVLFWNDSDGENNVFAFRNSKQWAIHEEEIYDYFRRPFFISINSSDQQLAAINAIMRKYPVLTYNQAVFVFSQLNNSCKGIHRTKCRDLVDVVDNLL